jgi:hypothetical protein
MTATRAQLEYAFDVMTSRCVQMQQFPCDPAWENVASRDSLRDTAVHEYMLDNHHPTVKSFLHWFYLDTLLEYVRDWHNNNPEKVQETYQSYVDKLTAGTGYTLSGE